MELLRSILSESIQERISAFQCEAISGGSINQTFVLRVNGRHSYFCKLNPVTEFPGLFEKEKKGLNLLAAQKIFRIPEVIACTIRESRQVLILEWIESFGTTKKFWNCFGEKLAALHKVSQLHFGQEDDNYMGALAQSNKPTLQWPDFFIHQRLEPQIRLAADHDRIPPGLIKDFENLYQKLELIFPPEKPSLLHGDLWKGNFLAAENDQPVLIDPAVYFGHRSMDLAMTSLFGGFGPAFYEAYDYHYPLQANFREQWSVCNLYPLLIHLNLFGKSYLQPILDTMQAHKSR